mgnify:FL=1
MMVPAWIAAAAGLVLGIAGFWPPGLVVIAAGFIAVSSGLLHYPTVQASRAAPPVARTPPTAEVTDSQDAAPEELRRFSSLRVVHANLKTGNTVGQELIQELSRLQPDVISLHEVDQDQLDIIVRAMDLPFVAGFPRTNPFGWAILSRYQFEAIGSLGEGRYPAEAIRIENGPDDVVFVSTHPPPPIATELESHMRTLFRDMAAELDLITAGPDGGRVPLVLAGDMNAVPWYRPLYDFVRQTGLRYARPATGPTAPGTFPAFLPIIPIDHVLARDVAAAATRPLGIPGSDHLALIADIWLPPVR